MSKRTTRKGNWLPSLYLFLMYGRVKTLDCRTKVREKLPYGQENRKAAHTFALMISAPVSWKEKLETSM